MLDGAARVGDVIAAAAADGQPAVGITDHGNMYGVLDFYKACHERGSSRSSAPRRYLRRPQRSGAQPNDDAGGEPSGEKLYYHLTLLAETHAGLQEPDQALSAAYLDGYYYKPRLDWELLEQHREGLIATTGCLGGVVLPGAAPRRRRRGARRRPRRLQDILGQRQLLRRAAGPRHRRAAPHQPAADRDREAASGPRCSPPTTATTSASTTPWPTTRCSACRPAPPVADENRFKFHGDQLYLKSAAEMRVLFRDLPRGVRQHALDRRAGRRRDRVRQARLPQFPLPGAHTEDDYLRELIYDGAPERYGDPCPADVVERIDYELGVIADMGFSAYFLVVWDLIRTPRDRGIRVGPRRGCAAGCAWRTACDRRPRPASATTCSSSGSSTRAASRCPTSTWTSTSATMAR